MASIAEIRAQYPQYQDLDDATLASALHKKFYRDMPFEDFTRKIGMKPIAPWSSGREAVEMLTMGGQSKLNAAGVGLIDAAASAVSGSEGGFWENFEKAYGRSLNEQRVAQEHFGEEHPVAKRAGQAGGLVAGITSLPGLKVVQGAGMVPAMANASATGAAYGAAGGALGDAESVGDRAANSGMGALIGAGLGPVAAVAAKGIGKAVSLVKGNKPAPVPTVKQIHDAKTQAYDAAKQSGLVLKPTTFNETADKIVAKFTDDAVDPDLQPKATVLMKRLQEAKDKPLTLNDLENLRKKAVRITQGKEKDEAYFAGRMIEEIDDFIDNLAPEGVTSGNPHEAAQLIDNARQLAKRARKSEVIETALAKAENAVGANYTQAGWQTAVQQQFRRIADNEKLMRLYNPDEARLIKAVVNGAKGQVLLNIIRKFNPSNAFALIGSTMNPALGVPALAVGQMAKMGSARMTGNAARAVDEMVRNGGVLPALPSPNPLGDALLNPLAQISGRFAGEYGPKLRAR